MRLFDPNARLRHRMPVFYGPSTGPRQGPDGLPFDWSNAPRTVASVSFLTDAAHLEALLPPGFSLDGDPIVSVEHFNLRELPWLAGRGYEALGMRFPARFDGAVDHVRGPLLTVMWENLTDAILTGREELGYSKLFADLPPPAVGERERTYEASWGGHRFLTLELSNLEDASPPTAPQVDGLLHYRYFPAVNDASSTDVATATMTPAGAPVRTERFQRGKGTVSFVRSSWEQLPTQYQIVNALADLPVREWLGATLAEQRGAKDLSDVRTLR